MVLNICIDNWVIIGLGNGLSHHDIIKWKHFLTQASEAELWCFLWSEPEQTVKQMIKTPVIWDIITLIMKMLKWPVKSQTII